MPRTQHLIDNQSRLEKIYNNEIRDCDIVNRKSNYHDSANLIVRLFFGGDCSPAVGFGGSGEGRSPSTTTIRSSVEVFSPLHALSSAPANPPRSGTLRIRGSYAVSCMKLGF
jgi:hypothetical protein